MMKWHWLLIVAVLVMVGCAPQPQGTIEEVGYTRIAGGGRYSSVLRTIDKEAGVVCWVFSGGQKGGISCLPLSETSLDK